MYVNLALFLFLLKKFKVPRYKLAALRSYHYLAIFFSIQQTSLAPKGGSGMLISVSYTHLTLPTILLV